MSKQIAYFAVMLFVCIFVAVYSNMKICVLKKNILKIEANFESQKDSLIKIIDILMATTRINASKVNNCMVRKFYWNGNEWHSLGRKTATGPTLQYKTPNNALFILKNITKDRMFKTPFVMENGAQQWFQSNK